jgi:hypothetical protein
MKTIKNTHSMQLVYQLTIKIKDIKNKYPLYAICVPINYRNKRYQKYLVPIDYGNKRYQPYPFYATFLEIKKSIKNIHYKNKKSYQNIHSMQLVYTN